MLIEDYFSLVDQRVAQTSRVVAFSIAKERRSRHIGFIKGVIEFADGSNPRLMECVSVRDALDRYERRSHDRDRHERLIFRYDMAPHIPGLATWPHHKPIGPGATSSRAVPSAGPSSPEGLTGIERLIAS